MLTNRPFWSLRTYRNPPTGYAVQGRRSVRHYKRENVSPALLQGFSTVRPMRLPAAIAQNLLVSVVDDIAAMDAFRTVTCVWTTIGGNRLPCRISAPRVFLSAGKLWKAGGWDAFSARSALRDRGQRECDLRRAGSAHHLSYFELMAQARDRHALVRPAVLVSAGRAARLPARLVFRIRTNWDTPMLFGYPP